MDRSGGVSHHPHPKAFWILPELTDLQPSESEIVNAGFQSEKSIRGEPMESCKLRYFNSLVFFDHTPRSASFQLRATLALRSVLRAAAPRVGFSHRSPEDSLNE